MLENRYFESYIVVDDDPDDVGSDEAGRVGDHVGDAHQGAGVVGRQVDVVDLQIT